MGADGEPDDERVIGLSPGECPREPSGSVGGALRRGEL